MGCGTPRQAGRPKAGAAVYILAPSKKEGGGCIRDVYDLDATVLGEGGFGFVRRCRHKATGVIWACKTIRKATVQDGAQIRNEIDVMKAMDHPNIIRLNDAYEDRRNIYLVMGLCEGGELCHRILDAGHFTEVQAAIVMQHIFRAISYMHLNRIVHRDLKPENVLSTTSEPIERTGFKIIDFGMACGFCSDAGLSTIVGTPYYIAPEVLAGRYDQAADLWSCGVVVYLLLVGYPPFNGRSLAEVLAKVRLGAYVFREQDWWHISEDAKDLVKRLLSVDPKGRCTAKKAVNHVWVASKAPRAKDDSLSEGMVKNLMSFWLQNKLKKVALHIIAQQMKEETIWCLQEAFVALDQDADGCITIKELKEGLPKVGYPVGVDLDGILEQLDNNSNGVIDYTEFLAATLDRRMHLQEDVCWAAFQVFDRDGSGKISLEELRDVVQDENVQHVANCDLADLMKNVDSSGDGEIDFQEFMVMMRDKAQSGAAASPEEVLRRKTCGDSNPFATGRRRSDEHAEGKQRKANTTMESVKAEEV